MNKIFDKRGLLSQIQTRSIAFKLVRVYLDFDILVECCRTVDGAFEIKTHKKERVNHKYFIYAFSARIDGSKKFYFNNFVQFLS